MVVLPVRIAQLLKEIWYRELLSFSAQTLVPASGSWTWPYERKRPADLRVFVQKFKGRLNLHSYIPEIFILLKTICVKLWTSYVRRNFTSLRVKFIKFSNFRDQLSCWNGPWHQFSMRRHCLLWPTCSAPTSSQFPHKFQDHFRAAPCTDPCNSARLRERSAFPVSQVPVQGSSVTHTPFSVGLTLSV